MVTDREAPGLPLTGLTLPTVRASDGHSAQIKIILFGSRLRRDLSVSRVASVTRNAEAAIVIRQVSHRLSSTSADDGVTWTNGETRRQEWRESIHRSLVTFRFPVATHFFFFFLTSNIALC